MDGSTWQIDKLLGSKSTTSHVGVNGMSKKHASKTRKPTDTAMATVVSDARTPASAIASNVKTTKPERSHKRASRPNPVKICEHPDIFQIDKHTHTYGRVRFSRGQPVVDIRHYTPDVKRPQFYYTEYKGSLVLPHAVFKSLLENGAKISELLEQYDGRDQVAAPHDGHNPPPPKVDVIAVVEEPAAPTPAQPLQQQYSLPTDNSAVDDPDLIEIIG